MRNSPDSFAIFAAIRRASSRSSGLFEAVEPIVLACYRSNTFWRSATESGTLASSLGILNTERWETGLAALTKFRRREGHCCPRRRHVDGNFKLGQWVSVQRYRKGFMPVERKRLLNAIGFVWDWRDYHWEQNFAALLKFKQREGHCCVPTFHSENGLELGWWVATQRRYKNKKKISPERRARLNKVGFVWNAPMGPPIPLSTKNPSRQRRSATR